MSDRTNTFYQTTLFVEGSAELSMCDTIFYQGEPWLVLSWRMRLPGEPRRPERIMRLSAFRHQEHPSNLRNRYTVSSPLPRELVYGDHIPKEFADDVIDRPEVSVPIGSA